MELLSNEMGSCLISEKAIKEIADVVCSNMKNIYPVKKDKEFAECKISKNDEISLLLSLRVKQGIDIVKLCSKLQDEISENILLMLGLECKRIDIDIQGFESSKK